MNSKLFEDKIRNSLPHGSVINADWCIKWNPRTKKVEANNSYQVMNEDGYYVGWAAFTVKIPMPHWEKFTLQFNGKEAHYLNKKYMLRDYLEDTIFYALEEEFNREVQKC